MVHRLADHPIPTKYQQEARSSGSRQTQDKEFENNVINYFFLGMTQKSDLEIREQKERKEKGETFN